MEPEEDDAATDRGSPGSAEVDTADSLAQAEPPHPRLEFVSRGYGDPVTRFDVLGRLVNRLRLVAARSPRREQNEELHQASETFTNEQLHEFLHCWTLPGGTLPPEQARALLAWSETPDEERKALKASIAATEQQVEAKRLAPNQRRGHVSWLDRLKHVLGR